MGHGACPGARRCLEGSSGLTTVLSTLHGIPPSFPIVLFPKHLARRRSGGRGGEKVGLIKRYQIPPARSSMQSLKLKRCLHGRYWESPPAGPRQRRSPGPGGRPAGRGGGPGGQGCGGVLPLPGALSAALSYNEDPRLCDFQPATSHSLLKHRGGGGGVV